MIEQAIYFSLGCVVTALLALLFAPVFWSRALRLTRRRLQLRVPLSMQEILAGRDQLRAAHAVDRLQIEQEMARVRAEKDADMIAIGRHSVEAARLAEEVEAFRKLDEAQKREIELLTESGAAQEIARGELRRELQAAHADVAALRTEADAAVREHARLTEEGEGHRTSAAALVAKLARFEEAQATIRRLEENLEALHGERDGDRERQREQNLGRSLKAGAERAAGRASVERLDALESENAALRQALIAVEAQTGGAADDDALRESIHALGLAVATMTRANRKAGTE